MKFSIKDFFSKCEQILIGKLHFLCSVTSQCLEGRSLKKSVVPPSIHNMSKEAFTSPFYNKARDALVSGYRKTTKTKMHFLPLYNNGHSFIKPTITTV